MQFSELDRAFIAQHLTADPRQLLLKHGREKQPLIAQIEARQKARQKLPTWYENVDLVFPAAISVEQSSSEATARYKASLVSGKLLIDLTGGMGVDTSFFATRFQKVIYLEQDEALVVQARYNFATLGLKNIECICANSVDFLHQFSGKADWIYADPARRATTERGENTRVQQLQDCQPDVTQFLPLLHQKSNNVLLKAAPLLDIKQAVAVLQAVASYQVVAVKNEVKEILFVLNHAHGHAIVAHAINLNDTWPYLPTHSFVHSPAAEASLAVALHDPLRYVYEPNAAILKTGAFKSIAEAFGLYKIAPNSHLYTSETLRQDFPGRIFELQAIAKADAKALATWLPNGKANLTIRNFPGGVDALKKTLKIKDGGEVYLFATTLANGDKRILVCQKPSYQDSSPLGLNYIAS